MPLTASESHDVEVIDRPGARRAAEQSCCAGGTHPSEYRVRRPWSRFVRVRRPAVARGGAECRAHCRSGLITAWLGMMLFALLDYILSALKQTHLRAYNEHYHVLALYEKIFIIVGFPY